MISLPESKLLSITVIEESTLSSLYFLVTESNNSEQRHMCGIGYILHVVTRDVDGDFEGFI